MHTFDCDVNKPWHTGYINWYN